MSDVNANIGVHIDTSDALAQLKALQREIATFHSSIARTSAASVASQKNLQTNLLNSVNATGKFTAQMGIIRTSTESFTHALETNKFSMREYFRYAGASTQSFGRLFKSEFNTIGKVAEERVKKLQTQYIKMGRDANGAMRAMAITPTTLNMKDFNTQTAIAAQKQAIFGQLLKQGSTSMLNFGKNTQWAGRQLMVGFSVPLMYFMSTASKAFMDLEKEAVKFKRVYGDMFTSTADTAKALAEVQQVANGFVKYGVAAKDTLAIAADIAAMGKTGVDLTTQLTQATKLSVLGNIDQQKALETTISIQNAFGISTEQLSSKIDFLNAVENQTVLNIDDMTTAIPKVAPVIKQLGGTIEDATFFMTAMKEGGIEAAQGANAIKSAMASIINPTKAASEFLAGFGVNIKGIVENNAGNLRGTIAGVAQALDSLDPLNRARAIEMMFGKFQFSRISTMFQNIVADGSQANKVLGLTSASVEELAILSQREMKTVEDAVGTNFKASIEKLKLSIAPIGKTFLQAVTPIAKVLGDLFNRFDKLSDGTKKFIVTAATLGGILGPLALMTFGLLANGAANIIKLFLVMRTGFMRLGGESVNLGEQLTYFNQEQLQSATIAASLNQAHTQLTQKFEMEAAAVAALRSAYLSATLAAKNFALANPGMMRGGGRAKFANGTTGLPGQRGAGDVIPIMAAPGEAIIPAKAAQDPNNKPLISALVHNGKLPGFIEGTTGITFANQHFNAKTQSSAIAVDKFLKELKYDPVTKQYTYIDPTGQTPNATLTEERIIDALRKREAENVLSEKNKGLNLTRLQRALVVGPSGYRGANTGTSLTSTPEQKEIIKSMKPKFAAEVDHITKALQEKGYSLDKGKLDNLFSVQKSHVQKDVNEKGIKQWQNKNLVPDLGYVNNYLNDVSKGLGANLLKKTEAELAELGINKKDLKSLVGGKHPTTGTEAETLRAIAKYDLQKNGSKYTAEAVIAGIEYRGKTGYYSTKLKTFEQSIQKLRESKEKVLIEELISKSKNPNQSPSKVKIVGVQLGEIIRHADGTREKLTTKNTKPMPTHLKSSASGDNRVAILPEGSEVVKGRVETPKKNNVIIKPRIVPGHSNAPYDNPYAGKDPQFVAEQKSLRRNIEKTQAEQLKATKAATVATEKAVVTQNETNVANKEYGAKMKMGVNVASGAIFALSFMNNSVGEFAQKLIPAAVVIPLLLQVLTTNNIKRMGKFMSSPWAAAAAVVISFYMTMKSLRDTYEKAQKNALALNDATGSGVAAMKSLSTFAKKVGSAEILAYRNQQSFTPFQIQKGKSTYGSNFVKSDEGKAMTSQYKTMLAGSNPKVAADALMKQLSTAVISGIFTPAQAKSIAVNVGEQMGNVNVGLKVAGQLTQLIGNDGQNLLDPNAAIDIRVRMVQEATKSVQKSTTALGNVNGGPLGLGKMNKSVSVGGMIAAGAGIGAALGTVVPGVGNAVGAVAGTAIGALAAGFTTVKMLANSAKELGALSGASIATQKDALSINNEMKASLQIQYENAMKIAKAKGDINKQNEIQKQYERDSKKLNTESANLYKAVSGAYTGTKGQSQKALVEAAKRSAESAYKGTNQEAYVAAAQTSLSHVAGNNQGDHGKKEYILTMQMASGNIAPQQMINLMNIFGSDAKQTDKIMNVIAKFGGQGAANMEQVLGTFTNKDGTPNKKVQTEFLAQVSAAKTPEEFRKLLDFYTVIGQNQGVMDVDVIAGYYEKHPDARKRLQKVLDMVKENDGKLTYEIVTNYISKGAIDEAYFNSLDQQGRAVYTKEVATIINMSEAQIKKSADYKKWEKTHGSEVAGLSWADAKNVYAKAMGWSVTEAAKVSDFKVPGATSQDQGSKTGPTASPLDAIVKQFRDVDFFRQKLTVGWKASMAALKGMFNQKNGVGLEEWLQKQTSNKPLIDLMLGMSPEEFAKAKNILYTVDSKGHLKALTNDAKRLGKELKEVMFNNVISGQGKILDNIKRQHSVVTKLTATGMKYSDALQYIGTLSEEDMKALASTDVASTKWQELLDKIKATNDELAKTPEGAAAAINNIADTAIGMIDAEAAVIRDQANAGTLVNPNNTKETINLKADQTAITNAQKEVNRIQGLIDIEQGKIDYNNHLIDGLNHQSEGIDASIAVQQGLIDSIEKQAAAQFDAPLQKLSEESNVLGNNLSIIDHQAAAINKQYDDQAAALEQVNKLNQDAINQGKQRISIADALSQGDIAAAAQAVQDARAQQAATNAQSQQSMLDAARKQAVDGLTAGGMTKAQIEERQYQISQESFVLEQQKKALLDTELPIKAEIARLEATKLPIQTEINRLNAENYTTQQGIYTTQTTTLKAAQDTLKAAEDKAVKDQEIVDKLIEQLSYSGKTKDEWIAIKDKADLALKTFLAVEKSTEASKKAAEGLASALKGLDGTKITTREDHIITNIINDVQGTTVTKDLGTPGGSTGQTDTAFAAAALIKLTSGQTLTAAEKKALGMAKGGIVPRYLAGGGTTDGPQGTDTIPAWLTPGEYVVNAKAANVFGPLLEAINTGNFPAFQIDRNFSTPSYNTGQGISQSASSGSANKTAMNLDNSNTVYNYNLSFSINGDQLNSTEIANTVINRLKQLQDQQVRGQVRL